MSLPTLDYFDLKPSFDHPVYIRSIDKMSYWSLDNINEIVNKTFKERPNRPKDIYSLWKINSNEDFYGVIASLSSNRNPRDQNIDFIWITEEELKKCQIEKVQTLEGNCLFVQHLHYNVTITRNKAINLCTELKQQQRQAYRCKKNQTKLIIEYQSNRGCKALTNNESLCDCEKS